jgi:electron transport complex protein RnfG
MSATSATQTAPTGNSMKMLRAMVGIGILCALMIVLTFEGTMPAIEKNKAEALQQAIFKVLPGVEKSRTFQYIEGEGFVDVSGEKAEGEIVYAGYNENGELAGLAIEGAGQGYADIIRILYGYVPAKENVVGFYVLESKETPGLGDKIEKDENFLANFEALDVSLNDGQDGLVNEVVPVKSGTKQNAWEVDAITGATISSRAIASIINASMNQWAPRIHQNRESLMIEKMENSNNE